VLPLAGELMAVGGRLGVYVKWRSLAVEWRVGDAKWRNFGSAYPKERGFVIRYLRVKSLIKIADSG
jgi:hypothetical protein